MTLPEESKPRINHRCLSDSGVAALRRARPPCRLARNTRHSYLHAPLDLPEQVEPSDRSIESKRGSVGRIERPVAVPPVCVVVCPSYHSRDWLNNISTAGSARQAIPIESEIGLRHASPRLATAWYIICERASVASFLTLQALATQRPQMLHTRRA